MIAETVEGGCFCGAVRYRMTSKPMFVHACHCRDCQTQTGGPFAINALIEADRVETLKGETEGVVMATESGAPHVIHRCPACRTALWSVYGGRDFLRFVRVTTLDEPDGMEPDIHIFTRSKLPWLPLPEGKPAVDVYYDSAQLWPAESLARRAALFAGG